MTPELLKAFASLSINPIAPGAYDKVRQFVAPMDLAFNFALDKLLRTNSMFTDGVGYTNLLDSLGTSSVEHANERLNLLNPLMGSEDFQQEVVHYLNGDGKVSSVSETGKDVGYELMVRDNVLTVGVKPQFLAYFNGQSSLKDFYRNCLELCQTTIPGADLRGTPLFAKFVKLSISF